jgi:hypothetical protein
VAPFDQMRSASELLAQRAMERVIDLAVHSLDVNELVQQVDVDTLLSRLDMNALLKEVNVNSLLRQVDVDALLGQVDVDALLNRVDLDAVLDRVDVNHLITRVDMDAIARRADFAAVVGMSSGSVATRAADIVRGQAVAMDQRIDRWVRRLLRRKGGALTSPPTRLNAGAGT